MIIVTEQAPEPQVYSLFLRNAPNDAVYIGRGSAFQNPFVEDSAPQTEEALNTYAEWFYSSPATMKSARESLQGKNLVCSCNSIHCHGQILIAFANE